MKKRSIKIRGAHVVNCILANEEKDHKKPGFLLFLSTIMMGYWPRIALLFRVDSSSVNTR